MTDSDNTTPDQQPQQQSGSDVEATTIFAQTNFRNENRRFGIKLDDRRRHMYVIGKTGMGKSTLLENMIIQDIQAGKGLAVVDPHGDLVEKVIHFIPNHRINDVVYFNPSDLEHPISFNILESVNPEHKNLVSNGLVGVFKKIWADSWGPRLEYILINTILALLDYPGSTLLGVTRMLVDGAYRKRVMRNIQDPVVKSFWVNEFNNYSEKFRNEAIAPIQNKVGQFLSSQLIRNIVGQPKSTIDMRDIMDNRKILLMNLSKGRIGEENAALLGAMMITKIQLAAMSRVDIHEDTRRDFYLYVDEFQNFSTESFAGILSEARKYRLNIIMAHQYIEQLSDEVKAAVFGNVGTMVVFRVGATDAEEFEKEFEPTFMKDDIVALPSYHVYLRLMIDGVASEPFSATTLPPISGKTDNREKVVVASRERYAKSREKVEERIMKWTDPANSASEKDTDDDEDMPEDKADEAEVVQPAVQAQPKPAIPAVPAMPQLEMDATDIVSMPNITQPTDDLDEFRFKQVNFVTAALAGIEPQQTASVSPDDVEFTPAEQALADVPDLVVKPPTPAPVSKPAVTSTPRPSQPQQGGQTDQSKKRKRKRKPAAQRPHQQGNTIQGQNAHQQQRPIQKPPTIQPRPPQQQKRSEQLSPPSQPRQQSPAPKAQPAPPKPTSSSPPLKPLQPGQHVQLKPSSNE